MSSLASPALDLELLEAAAARALLLKKFDAMILYKFKGYLRALNPGLRFFWVRRRCSSRASFAAVEETRLHVTRAALRRDQSGPAGILRMVHRIHSTVFNIIYYHNNLKLHSSLYGKKYSKLLA